MDRGGGDFEDGKQSFDDGEGGAIEDGRCIAGESDKGGGDVETIERGEDVFDGVDEDRLVVLCAEDEGCGADVRGFDEVIDVGGDGRKIGVIGAREMDTGSGVWCDGEGDWCGGKERGPGEGNGGAKRLEGGCGWSRGWGVGHAVMVGGQRVIEWENGEDLWLPRIGCGTSAWWE